MTPATITRPKSSPERPRCAPSQSSSASQSFSPSQSSSPSIRRSPLGTALAATLVALVAAALPAAPAEARTPDARPIQIPLNGEGVAAVYSNKLHGRKTASGQRYDKDKLTAAHKTLPFGTRVRLTYEKSGKSAVVTINDRGPHQPDREFDLSRASALAIGMKPVSLERVRYEILP